MKKSIYALSIFIFLAFVGCSATTGSVNPSTSPTPSLSPNSSPSSVPSATPIPQTEIQSVTSGTSFGFCMGYCNNQVLFSSDKFIASKSSINAKDKYPDVNKDITPVESEWSDLVKLVDTDKFNSLDERIGCPDCADGGAEFIEIKTASGTKRVTFEFNSTVTGIESLVNKLRELRNKYLETIK